MAPRLRSSSPEIQWPALPSARAAAVLALLAQLDESQWWSAERLLAHQMRQLSALLAHAHGTVPFYRERLAAAGWHPGDALDLEGWRSLPLLGRREVQSAGQALLSRDDLKRLGGSGETQTSGSTGEPVKLRRTVMDQLLWDAVTLRDHRWHARDLSGKLASIRVVPKAGAGAPPHGTALPDWGPPAALVWETGPSAVLSVTADTAVQARWLLDQDPDCLLTLPTVLAALLEHGAEHGLRPPRLREVRTLGETLAPALRAECEDRWQVPVVDLYSSQEMGYMALQCPESGRYHLMSECVLLEVLDGAGAPCAPGETGRVVVTGLHNLAMPLIRYEIGDFAEAGAPCPCGRGLPTLNRILGRTRNLVTLPGGARHWPIVGFARYREIAPVRQFQLVQHSLEEIEMRLVVDRALGAAEEARLAEVVRGSLGAPFRVRFRYYDGLIPRGPGGKFEEFVSLVE